MPRIPTFIFMGSKESDFVKNIDLTMKTFMPEKTIMDLRAHWRDNNLALDIMKRMNIGNLGGIVIGKGSGRRKENTKLLEANLDKIFKKKVDPEEKRKDDGYGNLLEKDNGKD